MSILIAEFDEVVIGPSCKDIPINPGGSGKTTIRVTLSACATDKLLGLPR